MTATVAPAIPAAGTPAGSVTFADGTTTLATVPLNGGRASLSTGKFQPGRHGITATYSGDPGFTASSTPQPTDVTVGFSAPCVTAHHGRLTVASGQSLCMGPGGEQDGPVTVKPGGALAVSGVRINGPVAADGAAALTICRSTLSGPLGVNGTTGFVLIGSDRDDTTGCAGNTFEAPVHLNGNTGGMEVSGNTLKAPVTITGNSGSGLLPDQSVPEFEGNQVGGPLSCDGNIPTLSQAGNTADGPRSGQCR